MQLITIALLMDFSKFHAFDRVTVIKRFNPFPKLNFGGYNIGLQFLSVFYSLKWKLIGAEAFQIIFSIYFFVGQMYASPMKESERNLSFMAFWRSKVI